MLKLDRRKNKAKKLKELKNAKDTNDSKKYWQIMNKNKTKKQKLKTNLTAIDFKLQMEKRDLELSESMHKTKSEFITHMPINISNNINLNNNN